MILVAFWSSQVLPSAGTEVLNNGGTSILQTSPLNVTSRTVVSRVIISFRLQNADTYHILKLPRGRTEVLIKGGTSVLVPPLLCLKLSVRFVLRNAAAYRIVELR